MSGMLRDFLAIGLGGALGTALRYLLSLGALSVLDRGFVFATVPANLLGALLIGYLAASPLPAAWRPLLLTGFCGGFTTFSLFSLELLVLIDDGAIGLALAYGLGSVVVWVLACWAGFAAGARHTQAARGA